MAGAIGGCTTLPGRNPNAVAESETGLGGTTLFRVNTLTPRVAIAFFFEARRSKRELDFPVIVTLPNTLQTRANTVPSASVFDCVSVFD